MRPLVVKILLEGDRGRAYVSDLLEKALEDERLSPLDRALATAMVYATTRHLATIDRILGEFSDVPVAQIDAELKWVLRTAVCQLLFMEKIPAYAVLDEAAELAKRHRNRKAAGFATGILRAIQRATGEPERDGPAVDGEPEAQPEKVWPWTVMDALTRRWPDLPWQRLLPVPGGRRVMFDRDIFPDPEHDPSGWLASALSHPAWLVRRWLARFGAIATLSILETGNRHPEISARPNVKRCSRELLIDRLQKEKVEVDDRLRLAHTGPIFRLGAFKDGWFTVQDEAAQRVAPLLLPQPGELVADLCAAPGGKASHLVELGARVVAADSERSKVRSMLHSFERLRHDVPSVVADAKRPPFKPAFDAALVDVPCSNTGVLSRRVEARWRLRERDVRTLPKIQRAILEAAISVVRPGGRVVYSTCSLEDEENGALVREAIRDGNGLKLEEELRILPNSRWTCGGYAARIGKMRT